MADVSIRETCACGASFSCTGSTYRSAAGGGTNGTHRGAEEMAERWRVEHKHAEPVLESTHSRMRPVLPLRGRTRLRHINRRRE